jgi:hypothetical protein
LIDALLKRNGDGGGARNAIHRHTLHSYFTSKISRCEMNDRGGKIIISN